MAASSLPSMKGLHALPKLAEAGSLTAAAITLGVTRSALSHRIADLEAELGVKLLHKSGRRAVLTEQAETLLIAIGDSITRIEAAIEPLRQRRMQIRLSTVATFASLWLLPRIHAFQLRHPDIMLSISTTRRVIDLQDEVFDCAIRHGLGKWNGLSATLLFREMLVPVAIPAIASIETATIIRANSRYRDWPIWWARSGQTAKLSDDGLAVENSAQALDAALAGAGIAVMNLAYVESHVAAGKLHLLGKPVQLPEAYYFVHRSAPRNERLITALRNWLIDEAANSH